MAMTQEELMKYVTSLVAHYNSPRLSLPLPPPGSERTPIPPPQGNVGTVPPTALSTAVQISFPFPPSITNPLPIPSSFSVSPMNISREIPNLSIPIFIPPFTQYQAPPPQSTVARVFPSLNIPDVSFEMVTGDPEPLQTLVHGDEGNPIDPDLGYDIKATGDALKAEGKLPKLPTRRSKRMLKKLSKRVLKLILIRERRSDDSQDRDFSVKDGVEESVSSSEEVQIVGSKRKTTGEVKQHPVKKAGGTPSANTYMSPAKSTPHDSDNDSVVSTRKGLSRQKERAFKRKEDVKPLKRVAELGSATEDESGKLKRLRKGKGKIHSSNVEPTLIESAEDDSDIDVSKAYNHKLYTYDSKQNFQALRGRPIHSEKKSDGEVFHKFGLDFLLKDRGLWGTVVNVGGFEPNIIQEFYANFLKNETTNLASKKFAKSYVRGMICDFSPSSINQMFGLSDVDLAISTLAAEKAMVHEISGGKLKRWTSKTSASQLTCKYVALYTIAIQNWLPTSNSTLLTREQAGNGIPFNFGSVVTNILRAASKSKPSNVLIYPNLIYRLLKDQGYRASKGVVLTIELALLSFEKALLYSDKRLRDLSFYLPPLSQGVASAADADDDVAVDVDPTSATNIFVSEAYQILSLLIGKVETVVGALEDLKEVAVSLKKLHAALSPAHI